MTTDPLRDMLDTLTRHGLDLDTCRQAVAEVRQRWGGSQVYIPRVDRREREREIRAGLEEGQPPHEIAAEVGVCVRTIRRKRAEWW